MPQAPFLTSLPKHATQPRADAETRGITIPFQSIRTAARRRKTGMKKQRVLPGRFHEFFRFTALPAQEKLRPQTAFPELQGRRTVPCLAFPLFTHAPRPDESPGKDDEKRLFKSCGCFLYSRKGVFNHTGPPSGREASFPRPEGPAKKEA